MKNQSIKQFKGISKPIKFLEIETKGGNSIKKTIKKLIQTNFFGNLKNIDFK